MACLLNISGNGIWDKFVNNFLQVSAAHFSLDDVSHLLPDVLDLSALGVAGLLGGHLVLLGEADAEDAEHVSVSGLDINMGLDQSLPLLHHGPQLVSGEVHAVEAGQTVLALDILNKKLELPEGSLGVLFLLQVSQGHLEHSALESISSNSSSSSSEGES